MEYNVRRMNVVWGCIMNHPTKNKGDLGVLKAKVDLCFKGYLIYTPTV